LPYRVLGPTKKRGCKTISILLLILLPFSSLAGATYARVLYILLIHVVFSFSALRLLSIVLLTFLPQWRMLPWEDWKHADETRKGQKTENTSCISNIYNLAHKQRLQARGMESYYCYYLLPRSLPTLSYVSTLPISLKYSIAWLTVLGTPSSLSISSFRNQSYRTDGIIKHFRLKTALYFKGNILWR
jgi:hypothetical protein